VRRHQIWLIHLMPLPKADGNRCQCGIGRRSKPWPSGLETLHRCRRCLHSRKPTSTRSLSGHRITSPWHQPPKSRTDAMPHNFSSFVFLYVACFNLILSIINSREHMHEMCQCMYKSFLGNIRMEKRPTTKVDNF
jgi:hypothetical protein